MYVVDVRKAILTGDQPDLQALVDQWAVGDVRVVADGDRFYLTAPEIDNPPNGKTCHDVAKQVIVRVNGLARVRNSSFRPVQLTGTYQDDDGRQHVFAEVPFAARAVLRVGVPSVVNSDGTIVGPPPPREPVWMTLTETNADLAEVVAIMGRPEALGWGQLYKVHEIIRTAIEPKKIHELGWSTRNRDSAFTGSANRADVSGEEARHARNSGQPPAQTMSLAEGRTYISELVKSWLDSLG